MGIKYLTVYAVFHRKLEPPAGGSGGADEAFRTVIMKTCHEDRPRRTICGCGCLGDTSRLDQRICRRRSENWRQSSKDNDGLHFQIAINYGSRDEIIRAMPKAWHGMWERERLTPDEISEETFSSYLDTAGLPDPDLLIRTSGEERLSNLSVVAAGLHGVLFHGCALAGFQQGGSARGRLKHTISGTADTAGLRRRRKDGVPCLRQD